ncbi:MAG: TolC family protein, partial [Chitinispirillales bacterium]|nr:TolC family protein [Chitinispirillales bacterium]
MNNGQRAMGDSMAAHSAQRTARSESQRQGAARAIGFDVRCALLVSVFAAIIATVSAQPLTLDQCVDMALESNLSIGVASEKLVEMDAAVKEAGTHNLPTLSGSASYTRLLPLPSASVPAIDIGTLSQVLNGYNAGVSGISDKLPLQAMKFTAPGYMGNVFSAGLSLTQVLYAGGKISNAGKIAAQSREAADWQRKSAVREVRRDVTKAYYTALAANRSIIALDSAISLMTVVVRDLGNAVDVGMRGEHELLQAKVQLANQRLARQQAATGAQAAHDYLSTLIGVPVNTPITLVEDMDAPESFAAPSVQSMQAQAREASTDIKALQKQLEIIETALLITNAANVPMVLANAGYNGQGIGWFGKDEAPLNKSHFTWDNSGTLSLVMQWDIYNGGAVSHKRAQTLSQKRQLELTIDNINAALDMAVKSNCA